MRFLGAYLMALTSKLRFLSGVLPPNRSELKDVFCQIVLLISDACTPGILRSAQL